MFTFSHIKKTWFTGYHLMEVVPGQSVFLARPEKSLLDLVYLTPCADSVDYLRELRLQNLDRLDTRSLMDLASASGRPKLSRAAERIIKLVAEEDYREI